MTHGRRQTGRSGRPGSGAAPALPVILLAVLAWALPAQTAQTTQTVQTAQTARAGGADASAAADPVTSSDLAALTALVAGADLSGLAEPGAATGDPAEAATPPAPTVIPADAGLIVNEVLADPATDWDGDGTLDAKGDEWIEVRNIGSVPLDLGAFWLRDSSGDTPDLQLSGTADPGEQVVFYGSDSVRWQAANGLSTTGFALNNTGDTVSLLTAVPGSSPVQYQVVSSVAISDHEAEDDRTGGFDLDHAHWLLFDALNPYPGALEPVGTGCPPSPGAENLCGGQVATESATFGAVKAAYR